MKTQSRPAGPIPGLHARLFSTAVVYFRLTKPRIALLLLISTAAGMLAAGGGSVSWVMVWVSVEIGVRGPVSSTMRPSRMRICRCAASAMKSSDWLSE